MHWSDEIEEICEKLRVNCVNLSEYHRKRFYYFKSYGKWFRLPLIILASLNSTASVGLQPVLDQQIISGITCLIGMIMGIIGSLELYLGIQTAMELELKHSKDYYTLAIHLYKTLSLRRENRLEDGKEYLNEKYSLYIKLCESSNLLDKKMKNDLLANVPDKFKSVDNNSTPTSDDINKLPNLFSFGDIPTTYKKVPSISDDPFDDTPLSKNENTIVKTTVETPLNKIKKTMIEPLNVSLEEKKDDYESLQQDIDEETTVVFGYWGEENSVVVDVSGQDIV